jgi:hypothetical protein
MIEQKYYHPEIKWYTRLNPWFWINNIDDPTPPAKFLRDKDDWPEWKIWLWWRWRNKLHNFMRYTIGLCGQDITVHSKYPGEMFSPLGYNWFIVQWGWLFLPGLSYYGKRWRWYIGWLDSGQFGLEFRER